MLRPHDSSIRSSCLWTNFQILRLTQPIRNAGGPAYSDWVDQVGDGVPPFDSCISLGHLSQVQSLDDAADYLFPPDILANPEQATFYSFLNPLNVCVDEFNQLMMSRMSETEGIYSNPRL